VGNSHITINDEILRAKGSTCQRQFEAFLIIGAACWWCCL